MKDKTNEQIINDEPLFTHCCVSGEEFEDGDYVVLNHDKEISGLKYYMLKENENEFLFAYAQMFLSRSEETFQKELPFSSRYNDNAVHAEFGMDARDF